MTNKEVTEYSKLIESREITFKELAKSLMSAQLSRSYQLNILESLIAKSLNDMLLGDISLQEHTIFSENINRNIRAIQEKNFVNSVTLRILHPQKAKEKSMYIDKEVNKMKKYFLPNDIKGLNIGKS